MLDVVTSVKRQADFRLPVQNVRSKRS